MNGSKERHTPLNVGLALACGVFIGWLGTMGCSSARKDPDFKLMAQAWNTIESQYVNRSSLHSEELTYGAISGMVDALGDTGHSTFLTPGMVKDLKNMERGEFKGIGIEIQVKGPHVVVVAPIDGSPAERAGLHPGDIILKVGGQDVTDWPLARVAEKITGKPGTKVSLTIQDPHNGSTRQLAVTRASVKMHDVTWHKVPGTSIAHIRVASFDNGVTKDLRVSLQEIEQAGLNGVILDLRNNPGGLLDEAIGVASQFLGDGVVLQAKDAKGKISPVAVEKGGLATNLPMAVIINEGSASAAEIVAGALQDNHRADLVGQTTFGTGTVLQEFRLSDGSALLLAVEEWLTPTGQSFWHKGVTPDFPVALPAEVNPVFPASEKTMTAKELQSSEDRQLLDALKLVTRLTTPANITGSPKPNS
ncbi:MAG TPA: S41 family peptidase [Verrucomicrobiae bacterium]|nr:S41 family peptidase [Verrucomicrobiae bacterium]